MAAADRRNDFLDVTAELIRQRGVAAVTMERVGQQSGSSRALIYKFFSNSDELLLALSERECAVLDAAIFSALDGVQPLEAQLATLLRTYLHHVTDGPGSTTYALETFQPTGGLLAEWHARRTAETLFFLSELIRRHEPAIPIEQSIILASALGAGVQAMVALSRAGIAVETLVHDMTRIGIGAVGEIALVTTRS